MNTDKFFDWNRQVILDRARDGCQFKLWKDNFNSFPFAVHKDGFLVFTSPHQLDTCDEYINGDPFGMEDNLESEFQKGRVKTTIRLISEFISDSSKQYRVLDVGCGQGHITAKILTTFPNMEVTGMDVSISAIKTAHKSYKGVDFIVGDAYQPPFAENYFDIIVCNNMWEHITDPVRMLEQTGRILKMDGVFIMSTPSRFRIMNLIKVITGKKVLINDNHITEYTVGQVFEQFGHAGFSISKARGLHVKGQGGRFVTRFFIHIIIKPVLTWLITLIGSHHIFESTAFYVGRKQTNRNKPS
ncbi:MAG: class I SAM-dependent methyltransferase [Firmicutes bacterium]|nr:class I SAM-dependent methyltransferase [Bacillota bacterium]